MTMNWQDIPEIIQFGVNHNIYVYFNTVLYPQNISLQNCPRHVAQNIIDYYRNFAIIGEGHYYSYNKRQLKDLTKMLAYWHQLE